MVSPEPDFWIHAVSPDSMCCIKRFDDGSFQCVDVARIAVTPAKGTVKAKADKGKADETAQYDYQDGSVHDSAVRSRILRGYERFKVKILPQQ